MLISNDPAMGAIRVNGQGTSGKYAACMRRFVQQGVLIVLVYGERLRPREVDVLTDLITGLHAAAPVVSISLDDGTPSGTRRTFEDCAVGVIILGHASLGMATTVSLSRQHTARPGEVFVSRWYSRRIHEYRGDLRLGNVVLIDGQPIPFDCLEFSSSPWWIDTTYDTALLSTNLPVAGLDGLVYRPINRYLERCGGYGGSAVLSFYTAMRALARVYVLLERAHQLGGAPDETASLRGEASRMLALSRHLLCQNNARTPLIHNLSGGGKSARAAQLTQAEGIIRMRPDAKRQRHWHVCAADCYLPRAVERTYRRLTAIHKLGVGADFPMIVDATFLVEHQCRHFLSLGRRLGAAIAIVDCVADVDTLRTRIRNRMRGGRDASEADLHVLDVRITTQEPLNTNERVHVIPGEMSKVVPYIKSRGQRFCPESAQVIKGFEAKR